MKTFKLSPKIQFISLLALLGQALLMLPGCVSTPENLQQSNGLQEQLSEVPVSENAYLKLDSTWLLPDHGTYLQQVKATIQGQDYKFSVHVSFENKRLSLVAFNDLYGRLYQLTWEPGSLNWTTSDKIPPALKPENIIADFLLVHSALAQLNSHLIGATTEEDKSSQSLMRTVKSQAILLRKIEGTQPVGALWQMIVINNPQAGYKLEIQTVPLS
ncbi:DUF3261 domain-containing protein [Candidatus Odyssella thessalonicensis]|uniref:DUF3261 domain-containing protein n=1 Tax=Candidatus Odyssella thessalonicensis TaxID=84647 RepID=UPI000225BFA6|nr:DUF3261 domain-containing protein [Candidatus Odyssella thessalonicensis]